jgi:hypothetical protein
MPLSSSKLATSLTLASSVMVMTSAGHDVFRLHGCGLHGWAPSIDGVERLNHGSFAWRRR